MTSINLRLIFTGLCAFVPNKPLGVPDDPPTKMKVVLVDGRHVARRAADEERLEPHIAAIIFKAKNIKTTPALPPESEIIWFLDGDKVSIKTTATPAFSVTQDGGPNSFEFVADFVKFMPPSFRAIHPSYLSAMPPAQVAAHVILDKGTLKVIDLDTSEEWRIHNPDICANPDSPYKRPLTNRVALELTGLPDVALEAVQFEDSTKKQEVALFAVTGERFVDVQIINLCDGYLVEPRLPVESVNQNQEDQDFRWYYELLSNYRTLKDSVQQAREKKLPIPKPTVGGGRPVQCMVAAFKDDSSI